MKTSLLVALALLPSLALPSLAWAESAGGISWKPPAAWKVDAPRQMRVATYKIAATKPDTDEGELAVFYFGKGQGGGVEDNIRRWAGQFEGSPAATTKKEKVAGLDVTRVEIEGTYAASMGPMGPAAQKVAKPGYKLLGAIIEAPEGAVFWKLTGPQKTVLAARAALDQMLKSVTK